MRSVCIVILAAAAVSSARELRRAVSLAPGTQKRITITVNNNPEIGDRFVIDVTSNTVKLAVITPIGRRINENTTETRDFTWSSMNVEPALGSTDAGRTMALSFSAPGQSGEYVFEFDASVTKLPSQVSVEFISERKVADAVVKSIPGVQSKGPIKLTSAKPSAIIPITIPRVEKGAIFDLVITDPAAKITLTLPNGRIVNTPEGKQDGIEWETLKEARDIDGPDSWFGLSGFLIHRDGTHHVFTFEEATPGTYQLRAQISGATPAEVTAAFIPLGSELEKETANLDKLGAAPPGQVRLRLYALPNSCMVGDPIPVLVGLTGDPVADPVNFKVRLEYRDPKEVPAGSRLDWADPVVEDAGLILSKTPEGNYSGSVVPSRPGLVRVGIQVNGKRKNGKPFSDEGVLGSVNVHRVAARFVSLSEKAVASAGRDRLERLDITAALDVVLPGAYEMRLDVRNADGQIGILASGKGDLALGKQTLTVSVPATDLRKRLNDGPFIIDQVQIFRPEGNSFGDFVATGDLTLKTGGYKRDQWDRGDAWTDEQVVAHGIDPASSGRFRLIEVEWGVTTPGGDCSWNGTLYGAINEQQSYVLNSGVLPKGRTTLSFVFEGTMVTRTPPTKWHFSPILSCQSGRVADDHAKPMIELTLDPAQFEPYQPLTVKVQNVVHPIRNVPAIAFLDVPGHKRGDVMINLGPAPPGIQLGDLGLGQKPELPARFGFAVTVDRTAQPGRYFIPITASAGSEKGETVLVVVIDP